MGTDNIITLFFLIVAALIFLNLRSVLGKRSGSEKPPYEPYASRDGAQPPPPPTEDGKVIALPRRDLAEADDRYTAVDDIAPSGTDLNKTLRRISDADPGFNPKEFINGAKMAYEMIVMGFAEGDRKSLKGLLSSEVYDGFDQAIAAREKAGEKVKSSFVGIEKADITAATMEGSEATITLKIVCQLISATYDASGQIIEGDAEGVAEVRDSWTFARDIRSRDPNWKLVSTQSGV
jgi:predicted lipid-binding transport protein (Tim44 family)